MNGKHMIDVTSIKDRYDCREVAARYTTLDKPLNGDKRERHAPCPGCGGTDRFFVSPGVWGCRGCGKGGDVISLIQLAEGLDFMGSVQFLDSHAVTSRTPVRPSTIPERSFKDDEDESRRRFLAHGPVIMDAAHCRLMDGATPGGEYLTRRGLVPELWQVYGLGYVDAVNGNPAQAIAMPWYKAGNLTGIRYRLLNPVDKAHRVLSETGSRTAGVLYGGQALTMWTRHNNGLDLCSRRTLVLVEGEINAMSVYQVAHGANVDVLSMGGESSKLPPFMLDYARRYRVCLVWMDKRSRAQDVAKEVGGAAYWSETDGKPKADANDHLQQGTLPALLVRLLVKATPQDKQEALQVDLLDGGLSPFV